MKSASMTDKKPELITETAARAIYEARNGKGCKAWNLLPGSHKEPYLADAKAAIDAYQEVSLSFSPARMIALQTSTRTSAS